MNNSKKSKTDYLRVRASKVYAGLQGMKSLKCTEREDNSSQAKCFFARTFGLYKKGNVCQGASITKVIEVAKVNACLVP